MTFDLALSMHHLRPLLKYLTGREKKRIQGLCSNEV